MSTNVIPLHIPLVNEGTDVLRPTTGISVAPDVVRVQATDDYDPDTEVWEFPPGSEVRCVTLGRVLTAAGFSANDSVSLHVSGTLVEVLPATGSPNV